MERKRGRPPTYSREERERIAQVIAQCGVRGAREVLEHRICQSTLVKIAREFGVALKKGRRRRDAV